MLFRSVDTFTTQVTGRYTAKPEAVRDGGERLTWHAAPHVGAQVLAVRAGTRVLGRVLRDLGSLQTQVLAAAVGHAPQVTAVRAWEDGDAHTHAQEVSEGDEVKSVVRL